MSKKKIIVFSLIIIFLASFVWLDFVFLENNSETFAKELKEAGETSDFVIIFNSGGFGTVKPELAYDLKPIIDDLKGEVEGMNYKVAVVPYYRTKETIIGRIGYLKEMFLSFPSESKDLAKRIKDFVEENPGDKVLMAGLSNGAAFVNETMEDLQGINNVFAIEMGTPFWSTKNPAENILILDNKGRDSLSIGDKGQLMLSLLQSPFKWIASRIEGRKISFSEAMVAPGHQYSWLEVEEEVVSFLESKVLSD
ncbi:MAG: hypothetical protein PHO19_02665 [Candidatus Pacebacteria bacterium]|nr:hypothetical protein [Candidatus Paceibacterota bacterium]